MKLDFTLDYELGEGWLAPWVEGLREGRAIASYCKECGAAHFPPLRICPESGERSTDWRTLSGRATILFRTTGADGDFALVRFDGAASAAVAKIQDVPTGIVRCALQPAPGGPPAIIVGPEEDA
ncbi:Zn-ribbon domain-containing OB-fold protein [Oricola sp.]|uniref:Zn-ribbon domain-containing OB-fold protein n=1 Tax=Oricola sp. TaxID=1979950 RepID=UPI003BA8CE33